MMLSVRCFWIFNKKKRCVPKQTIYVRYFSILLYLLNIQVAPAENKENKTSL
jgi:hypothetical protein